MMKEREKKDDVANSSKALIIPSQFDWKHPTEICRVLKMLKYC